ncbi:hypothetical protein EGR_00375 [Echinococcus granulosus]|uniref:Uncharacterized protein n=1 Tax=Echinococcus granulosus TaxID=6210 RepID=W6UWR2_ECHGR|nr:hypothetical protein EGR_00375 [Echinococcus granulosus]EUB65106.1 hypothetical protein EGR_00375 [Echinococcus granulosus]
MSRLQLNNLTPFNSFGSPNPLHQKVVNRYNGCYGICAKFSDGCRECKCENGAVFCKKGGCKFFSHPGQDVLDYYKSGHIFSLRQTNPCTSNIYFNTTNTSQNAQKLATKRKELSELETRSNTTTKIDLISGKPEELTDQEKAEATAKLQKLVESYISNQSNESTLGRAEESPHQTNQKGTIIEEKKKQKREIERSKPALLQESPPIHRVKPELGKFMSEYGLTNSNNSNGDSYVHPSDLLSNHDVAQIFESNEGYSRKRMPWKRPRPFDLDKHLNQGLESQPKRNLKHGTNGAVGEITVNRLSSWPLQSEHKKGGKKSAIYRSPEIIARGRDTSRSQNFMKNNLEQVDWRNRMLASAAHHSRYSLPKRFDRERTQFVASSPNWPTQEEDFWNSHMASFGKRYDSIPVQHYEGLKHLAGNKYRNYQRQSFTLPRQPRYASRQKTRLGKDGTIDVGSVPNGHSSAMKSAETIERNMRLIDPNYGQMQNNEVDEKKHQELLDEIETFTVLSNMAVNLLFSEKVSQNNSKAMNVRSIGEFKHIVAIIEESIQAIEAEIERFSLQTPSERQKLPRDIPERLKQLIDSTKKLRVMVSGADDPGDVIKSEQLNEILTMMEDIAATVSAAVEKEFEKWDMDSTDETPHLEGEGLLYDNVDDDENLAEANEAAAMRWKFTHCMMLCSRCLEMA